MKHIWTLPAVLRLALASQHAFSVLDDLLAYPQVSWYLTLQPRVSPLTPALQYKIEISDSFVTEQFAEDRLAEAREHVSPPSASAASTGQDLSKPNDRARASGTSEPGKDGNGDEELENTYEELSLNGDRFLCRIPIVIPEDDTEPALNETEKALQAEAEAKELARATNRGWELLQGMSGNCIYFVSGWWSYSFCYNDQITQFHPLPPGRGGVPHFPPTPDPTVQAYTLGMFPQNQDDSKTLDGKQGNGRDDVSTGPRKVEEKGLAKLETRGETRYLVQNLGGGTICDLTGRERKIEVQVRRYQEISSLLALTQGLVSLQPSEL
jgi:protein OS-9